MKINKEQLIQYLYNQSTIDNTALYTDELINIELNDIKFSITSDEIIYQKNGIKDFILITYEDVDLLFDKVLNYYTKENLNSEINKIIRLTKINQIIK